VNEKSKMPGVKYCPRVRQTAIDESEAALRLEASISGLADRVPEVSARSLLSRGQLHLLAFASLMTAIGLIVSVTDTLIAVVAVITCFYLALVLYRFRLFILSAHEDVVVRITDEEARAVEEEFLPIYTVLIPAYHEPEVIQRLIAHVGRIEYPAERLQVLLLAEADDLETIAAVREADPGPQFEVVLVPPSEPRTKPKALNYGLSLAVGDIVTIYDAEDVPDPLQLRRAVVGFARLPSSYACLQAKLSYHNPTQNLITKWFMIEYAMWFSFFLPGLASSQAPIPLGGTSNHFKRTILRKMGAWDPFNVTEDADLGVRMAREGYQIGVLESTTLEEANSDFVNWVRQRSRWYKGYLQTLVVHLREPRRFSHEVGWRGAVQFILFVGGTPILALLNPIFWLMTLLWFLIHPLVVKSLFPAPVYYVALFLWAVGDFLLVYLTVISCRLIKHVELLSAALLVPIYWVMMSMAAVKAFWQLATDPNHWEKTVHGLDETTASFRQRPH
jgi:cellulose synthase/poly-beta-1,6-N-acetylglucosamine synthase-like glycosyltransferase